MVPRVKGTLLLIELAGHVGLLLWGTHMIGTGVQRGFGTALRRWLGRNLARRWQAFLAGLGVTALLQSSTATGLLATSFAATGVIDLAPALTVMLGLADSNAAERVARETGLFLRMVRDLRRIHSHLASFAYPTLARQRTATKRVSIVAVSGSRRGWLKYVLHMEYRRVLHMKHMAARREIHLHLTSL
jgi:Na+/phosphate symporter